MYVFTKNRGNQAVVVFRFDDVGAAIRALEHSEVGLVGNVDLRAAGGGAISPAQPTPEANEGPPSHFFLFLPIEHG